MMKWFYFKDESTGVEVRWDASSRLRIIDPIAHALIDQGNINLVQVIQFCSACLKRKVEDN